MLNLGVRTSSFPRVKNLPRVYLLDIETGVQEVVGDFPGMTFAPRFLWTWPCSRISVMGGEQAASVLAQLKKNNTLKTNGEWNKKIEDKFKQPILEQFNNQSHPLYASARMWDDGIIDPTKTRDILAASISITMNQNIEDTKFGIFRM